MPMYRLSNSFGNIEVPDEFGYYQGAATEHSVKYVSRRRKELIKHAFIATGNEENEYGKAMVPRDSPFRSSSMDVLQSRQTSCRSNKWQTNPCKHGATLLQSPALKRHRCGKSGPNGGTCSGCFAVACAADDLDEILSDVEPVKAAVPWKNCWNQNGAATEVSWSCSLCVYSVSRPATFVGRRQLSFSKVDHIRTKHEGLVLVAGRFCSCASLATSRKMAVQRFHIERPTGTGTSSAWA